jgi:hypothetical protein
MTDATSAPKPIRVIASCATTARFVFFTDSTIASSSSGCSVRGSIDLDRDAVPLGLLGRLERAVHDRPGRDHGHVLALAVRARLAERDRLELLRHLFLHG